MRNVNCMRRIWFGLMLGVLCHAPFAMAENPASVVAAQVQSEVARTVLQSKGQAGRAVLVLDELHNSRAAQLQEALVLERLYYGYGVREVVLEGYLVEDQRLDTSWFDQAAGGDALRRARVAVQLLREGEINAAEYWKLVHPQVKVIAAETKAEHAPMADGQAHAAPEMYLLRIAGQLGERALRQDASKLREMNRLTSRLNALIKEFKELGDNAAEPVIDRKRTEVAQVYKQYQEFVVGLDPWTRRVWDEYREIELGSEQPSLEASVRIARAIEAKAKSLGLSLEAEEEEAMHEYLAFMQARHEGTLKLAVKLKALVRRDGAPVVAITGIGHSIDLAHQLDGVRCSYAFLRPLALDGEREESVDIPFEMYERKYHRQSIYSGGPLEQALEALPKSSHKKPPVVLNEPWFIGKAESYAFVDRITDDVFGGGPPYEPPSLPTWSDDAFRGKQVYVDPKRIQLIADDNEVITVTDDILEKLREEKVPSAILDRLEKLKDQPFLQEGYLLRQVEIVAGAEALKTVQVPLLQNVERRKQASVLIPLVFNRGTARESILWAKATRAQSHISSDERQAVEAILKDALEATKANKTLTESATDTAGRVQISFDTVVAFGEAADVRRISLSIR